MKHSINALFIVLIALVRPAFSQTTSDSTYITKNEVKQLFNGSSLTAQLFMGYQQILEGTSNKSQFVLKRGYLNFRKSINNYLSGRITPDITVDNEGDGKGDIEMRLKYCYMEFKGIGNRFFTEPSFVFGMVYTPWLEFEEKINRFRVQGTAFLDREGISTSGDFGFTGSFLIGGKVDADYQNKVNNRYAGRFGSVAIGLYNGGGYHALEENNNKVFEARISIRPFPSMVSGLQFSYTGAYGKGNTVMEPLWELSSGCVSYESERIVITGQYYTGIGNFAGSMVDANGKPYQNWGMSYYSEVRFYKKKVSLIGRFDRQVIHLNPGEGRSFRSIVGLAYHLDGSNKVLLDYDHIAYSGLSKEGVATLELMVELAF